MFNGQLSNSRGSKKSPIRYNQEARGAWSRFAEPTGINEIMTVVNAPVVSCDSAKGFQTLGYLGRHFEVGTGDDFYTTAHSLFQVTLDE